MRAARIAWIAGIVAIGAVAGARQTKAQTTLPPLPSAETTTTAPNPDTSAAPPPTPTATATATASATPTSAPIPPASSTPTVAPQPPPPAFYRFALQTEGAIGVTGPFYNHLVGARIDRCFSPSTCIGAYLAYANLKGQEGRTNNLLAYVLFEHRRPLGDQWFIPLRLATGYLPKNGPFARLSAGLGIRAGNVDVTFDLVAPTLWVTGNEPVVSLDLAAEVAFRF